MNIPRSSVKDDSTKFEIQLWHKSLISHKIAETPDTTWRDLLARQQSTRPVQLDFKKEEGHILVEAVVEEAEVVAENAIENAHAIAGHLDHFVDLPSDGTMGGVQLAGDILQNVADHLQGLIGVLDKVSQVSRLFSVHDTFAQYPSSSFIRWQVSHGVSSRLW